MINLFPINFAMLNKSPEKNNYPSITSLESFFFYFQGQKYQCIYAKMNSVMCMES